MAEFYLQMRYKQLFTVKKLALFRFNLALEMPFQLRNISRPWPVLIFVAGLSM